MSAMALAESPSSGLSLTVDHDRVGIEVDSCGVCGHPEGVHQLLLTSAVSYVVCHEPTDDGECYRVRHSLGIAFGACRREPS